MPPGGFNGSFGPPAMLQAYHGSRKEGRRFSVISKTGRGDCAVRKRWGPLVRVFVRLPRYARLVLALSRDPRIGLVPKAALGGAVLYNLSPVDLIPGVVPILGQLDDVFVLLFTVRAVVAACPEAVVREHLRRAGLTSRHIRNDPETLRRSLGRFAAESGRVAGRSLSRGASYAGRLWKRAAALRPASARRSAAGRRRSDKAQS